MKREVGHYGIIGPRSYSLKKQCFGKTYNCATYKELMIKEHSIYIGMKGIMLLNHMTLRLVTYHRQLPRERR